MTYRAGESPRARLLIQDRPASGPAPHGHAVDCPRRGATHLIECLDCAEFSSVWFERDTSMSFIECRPKPG